MPRNLPQSSSRPPLRIMVCAGEVSGDMHAAALVRAFKEQWQGALELRGFGGDALALEGMELIYHTDRTAIMGISPVIRSLPFLLTMWRRMRSEIDSWRPDLLLTVDYPGMNLRLAAYAHKRGIPAVQYISPKVWAWNRRRIPGMARVFELLLCILPFEPPLFKGSGLCARFVGHPLVDRVAATRAEPALELPWQGLRRVALLPGSRRSEISRILPPLLEAAVLLEERLREGCAFIVPAPNQNICRLCESIAASTARRPRNLHFVVGAARQVMLQAEVGAIASGTATLEASLLLCPSLLVYRVSRLTYICARLLIKGVKFIGLANIIAGREVMPELLQKQFTPARVATLLHGLLADRARRERALEELESVNALLGAGDASGQAAAALKAYLLKKTKRRD